MEDKEIDLSDAQKSVGYDDVYWEWQTKEQQEKKLWRL